MKKLKLLVSIFLLLSTGSKAQTTALDFTQVDCFGQSHTLFTELDSNNVVFMEFIMNCGSCIIAGAAIEKLIDDLNSEFPGKIKFYQFAYNSTMTCTDMIAFASTHGFNATPFEENDHMLAYYGGFGMPTVAVAAGVNHQVLAANVGFAISDTTQIGIDVRNFFATLDINKMPPAIRSFKLYPNPATDETTISLNLKSNSSVGIQLTDLNGKLISDIFNGHVSQGLFEQKISTSYAPGNYLVRIIVNGNAITKKIKIDR